MSFNSFGKSSVIIPSLNMAFDPIYLFPFWDFNFQSQQIAKMATFFPHPLKHNFFQEEFVVLPLKRLNLFLYSLNLVLAIRMDLSIGQLRCKQMLEKHLSIRICHLFCALNPETIMGINLSQPSGEGNARKKRNGQPIIS